MTDTKNNEKGGPLPYLMASQEVVDHVAAVAKRLGVEPPTIVGITTDDSMFLNAGASARVKDGVYQTALFIHPSLLVLLPKEAIDGAIAHELGHIALEHVKEPEGAGREEEFAADRWAFERGMRKEIKALLKAGLWIEGIGNPDPKSFEKHPSAQERLRVIKKLKAAKPALAMAA